MKTIIFLNKEWFTSEDKVILSNEYFNIKIFKYPSGIEGLTLENKKGYITLLFISIQTLSISAQENSPCIGCVSSGEGQPFDNNPE